MYGAVGASISVREQRKKSLSRQSVRTHLTPAKKRGKVHPQQQQLAKTHLNTRVPQLPNGKNAWGGKVGDKQRASEAQRRWMNKTKEEDDDDSSLDGEEETQAGEAGGGGGGSLEKRPDGRYRQTGVVNIVLYVGLGLVALGLIITFVGVGEHGFKSPELQLIGPSLIGCGFLFCLLRLFFCSAPACCTLCCRKNKPLDEKALLSPSRETLAEDSTESQPQKQQQQQPQPQEEVVPQVPQMPQRLQKHEEEEDHQEPRRISSKSAARVQSTIPNFIEDECEDDAALGLHVEYMDEVSDVVTPRQRLGGSVAASRPTSAQSRSSTASKVPRLPDIHTNGRQNTEIVLNPATLERSGD
ncbi:uncharacterized protein [Panulirus ornatus]|uniref:uncharacterized protein isoform X3 n=1 Tax=Panulirus ornatus TaxID=150431 RepID=UPI003A845F36